MLYDPGRRIPTPWLTWIREGLVLLLGVFLGAFILGSFEALRDPIAASVSLFRAILLAGGGVLLLRFLSPPSTTPTFQEGGYAFVSMVVLMCGWWISSTYFAHTGLRTLRETISSDPTVQTQLVLCGASIALLCDRKKILDLGENKLRWCGAFLLYLMAQMTMIADTDYQKAAHTIDMATWVGWRILNIALIVPTVLGGIAVVHGVALRAICWFACIVIVLLYLYLFLGGAADVIPHH